MKRSHMKFASLLAAFSLLAVVLTLWMSQPAQSSELKKQSAQSQHVLCTSSASASYLAAVKAKFSGFVTGNALSDTDTISFFNKSRTKMVAHREVSENVSLPLWLLNRALLI